MNKVLTNIKRINLLIIMFIILIFSISCKNNESNNNLKHPINDYSIFPIEMKGYLNNKKVYLTSIGQSSDLEDTEELVLNNLDNFVYEKDLFLKANDLEKDSVVLIFVGCSIKAMASAMTTIDKELDRAKEFVERANKKEISIICFHIGGEKRRGITSDRFIDALFSKSVFNVFLDKSDYDSYLSNLSINNDILGYIITSDLSLEKVFKQLLIIEA